jgi:tocopherol O-methyltransferase
MESGEHMPDKESFLNELVRVTTPGGRIIIVTWCHRELKSGETALTGDSDKELLKLFSNSITITRQGATSAGEDQ